MNSLGEVFSNATKPAEAQGEQLKSVLPKDYTMFSDELLCELLRIPSCLSPADLVQKIIIRREGRHAPPFICYRSSIVSISF